MNNVLTLAYLGDAVFEVYVRKIFIQKNIGEVNQLQKEVTKYVSAKGQAIILNKLLENNFLTEEEINIMKRARNHKVSHSPKNTDIITYKWATAFEAIIGYLYINNNLKRLEEVLERSIQD